VFNIASNNNVPSRSGNTSITTRTIVPNDEGWAQGIISIYIYGVGAVRLSLLRTGGTPLQVFYVIGGTLLT
jgi:hypothetical protein